MIAARAAPGPLRILFVGNVIERKGLHTILAAMARLPNGSCHLTVVGSLSADQRYVKRILRQIAQSDMAARVNLLGRLPQGQLEDQLTHSQVLAVPSYEGFGIVYLEAMAYGLPVIASTTGAAWEIVTPHENGFLVEPGDVDGLAHVFCWLHERPETRMSLGTAAAARFRSHPTWTQSFTAARAWLQQLLA